MKMNKIVQRVVLAKVIYTTTSSHCPGEPIPSLTLMNSKFQRDKIEITRNDGSGLPSVLMNRIRVLDAARAVLSGGRFADAAAACVLDAVMRSRCRPGRRVDCVIGASWRPQGA